LASFFYFFTLRSLLKNSMHRSFAGKGSSYLSILSLFVQCDVLVVGVSSAGLMAATSAAEGGASVVRLDRDRRRLHHDANTLFEGMAALSGVKIKDCLLRKELDGMRIISPSGRGVTIPAKGYFIDREAFDRHYLRLAEKAGVALLSGEVRSIRTDGNERK